MAINSQVQAPWGEYLPRIGRMTVEQFEQFPSADGWYFELHEGSVFAHQWSGLADGYGLL